MPYIDKKKVGYLLQHRAGVGRPSCDCFFKIRDEIVRRQGVLSGLPDTYRQYYPP
jgi:hypothetical protein